MSEVGESIVKGMEEALAFAKGEKSTAVVHVPEEINQETDAVRRALVSERV